MKRETDHKNLQKITDDIIATQNRPTHRNWYLMMGLTLVLVAVGGYALVITLRDGIGTWGLNRYVGWGWGITNFVWWVGIGHAGTFISAVLLLFRQKWRAGVNRAAESMTIFAILCAAIFPIIHMGRPWLFFFTLPYPNTRNLWVNFYSPLLWDVFAISTYFFVSLLFWYLGMLPDMAILQHRARHPFMRRIYRFLSSPWNGSDLQWARYEKLTYYMAAIAAPLVFSVHTIVSMDFATSLVPGWHSTIFPPYFVAGAIFSGFAMVQTLLIITRKAMNLELYITDQHIANMNKIILIMGSLVATAYFIEAYHAFYDNNSTEINLLNFRLHGVYQLSYLVMLFCNVITPQLLWIKKIRHNITVTFIISILINIGMWLERFIIIVPSLSHDYLPSTWNHYAPTAIEVELFIGTIGLFLTCYLIFCRLFPVISIHEIKTLHHD